MQGLRGTERVRAWILFRAEDGVNEDGFGSRLQAPRFFRPAPTSRAFLRGRSLDLPVSLPYAMCAPAVFTYTA